MNVPMGGRPRAVGVKRVDWPYPLICVCDTPDPEWVYVAHQCRRCRRVIPTGTEPFMVDAR